MVLGKAIFYLLNEDFGLLGAEGLKFRLQRLHRKSGCRLAGLMFENSG